MSRSSDLADAIVTLLNSEDNEWSMQFTAVRRSAPLTQPEIDDLHAIDVAVYTGVARVERRTRGSFNRVFKPIIGITRKLDEGDAATKLVQVDAIENLAEEIQELIKESSFDVGGEVLSFMAFDEEQDREQYGATVMQSFDVFVTALSLEYSN